MVSHDVSATSNAVIGATLVAVTFVWDYIQLQFEAAQLTDGARLTAHTLPQVELADRCWRSGDDGWRDSLCARIGVAVTSVSWAGQQLRFGFADGAVISVSLKDEDYRGPEAFELSVPGQDLIVA
jgi:hypothetical protein